MQSRHLGSNLHRQSKAEIGSSEYRAAIAKAGLRQWVFRSELFCTVFRKAMSESIDALREQLIPQTRRPTYILRRSSPNKVVLGHCRCFHQLESATEVTVHSGGHLVKAGLDDTPLREKEELKCTQTSY